MQAVVRLFGPPTYQDIESSIRKISDTLSNRAGKKGCTNARDATEARVRTDRGSIGLDSNKSINTIQTSSIYFLNDLKILGLISRKSVLDARTQTITSQVAADGREFKFSSFY